MLPAPISLPAECICGSWNIRIVQPGGPFGISIARPIQSNDERRSWCAVECAHMRLCSASSRGRTLLHDQAACYPRAVRGRNTGPRDEIWGLAVYWLLTPQTAGHDPIGKATCRCTDACMKQSAYSFVCIRGISRWHSILVIVRRCKFSSERFNLLATKSFFSLRRLQLNDFQPYLHLPAWNTVIIKII